MAVSTGQGSSKKKSEITVLHRARVAAKLFEESILHPRSTSIITLDPETGEINVERFSGDQKS